MNYNQYAMESEGPSKVMIGATFFGTTALVAAVTYALTAGHADASLYSAPAAVRTTARTAPIAQVPSHGQEFTQVHAEAVANENEEFAASLNARLPYVAQPAAGNGKTLLIGSFSAMMLAVASALAAAFGYRNQAIAMASGAGSRTAPKGGKAVGGQAGVGYKGSTQPGSAPTTRSGKPGIVYKLGVKNGRGNVDEYSPVYNEAEWKADGDVYEPGAAGLALWAAGFLALLGASAFLIFSTSNI